MDRGFTLLEVLIAMVILSIAFMWLLKAQAQGIDMAQRSRFMTTATLLAQAHIADMDTDSGTLSTGEQTGDFGEQFPGYLYRESMESTPISGYYKYTLLIFWGKEGRGFETKFITFLAAR